MMKAQSADEHSNHEDSQSSPMVDDDDAESDGVTDKSSLDEGDKKDGSSKKRKRRVRVNIPHTLCVFICSMIRFGCSASCVTVVG